jgi:ferredoxin
MVTVRVDPDLCVGHGRCYVLADDVFGADEFGHCIVLEEQVSAALEGQARMGADNCPEQAITIS